MPSLLSDIKAILTGLKVTLQNFKQQPVTIQYPWEYPDLPVGSRGMLRMLDFHTKNTVSNKSSWYPGTRWAPCTETCPAHTDARGYVTLAAEGKWKEGLELLRRTYPFVGTLGRICPAPCEKGCTRAFTNSESCAIRCIKRAYADWEQTLPESERFDYEQYCCSKPLTGKTVGVIGAGPAGYQCAMLLRSFGFAVHIYEAKAMPGGFLTHAIPTYRLPRNVVESEMQRIHSLPGIELSLETTIGKDLSFSDLCERHDEVVVAAGAWKAYKLGLEGESKPYVWFGEEFLEAQITGTLSDTPHNVVVVGGGNTGFDCARTCRRLGADVTMIYRRTRKEMPSEDEEIEDGSAEGVKLEWLTSPHKLIFENGKLTGIEVLQNRLGEKDRSGRRKPVPVEGSERIIPCDMVITALGREVDLPWLPTEIKQNRNGTIVVDSTGATSQAGVWACGDVVRVATVVAALGGADNVSLSIARKHECLPKSFAFLFPHSQERAVPYLDGTIPAPDAPVQQRRHGVGWAPPVPAPNVATLLAESKLQRQMPYRREDHRAQVSKRPADECLADFAETTTGYSPELAQHEALRCFGCAAEMCVGCGVCVDTCPDACIFLNSQAVDPVHPTQSRHYAADYCIDFTKCCFCGLCTEACPTKSLVMTSNFEMAVYDKREAFMTYPRLNLGLVRVERRGLGKPKTGVAAQETDTSLIAPAPEGVAAPPAPISTAAACPMPHKAKQNA